MAVGKEIRTKITSVKNTQKITKAMEMVAASKMRRAQDKMAASRPYADRMRALLGHIAQAHFRIPALLFDKARRSKKRRLYHRLYRPRAMWWSQCQSIQGCTCINARLER